MLAQRTYGNNTEVKEIIVENGNSSNTRGAQ